MFRIPQNRPRHRPRPVRIVCGTLGAGLLTALVVATVWQAGEIYVRQERTKDVLHLPSIQPPTIAGGEERFLIYVVGTTKDLGTGALPVLIHELDVKWPEDKGKELEWSFDASGFRNHMSLSVQEVERVEDRGKEFLSLRAEYKDRYESTSRRGGGAGDRTLPWKNAADRWSSITNLQEVDFGALTEASFLALVPRRVVSHIEIRALAARASSDDPLRIASWKEFLQETEFMNQPEDRNASRMSFGSSEWVPPGGFPLLMHVGTSLGLLTVPASLLSQLSRRRELAIAGLLPASMLLDAGLDRSVLHVHQARLAAKDAVLETRALVLDLLETSFFFRGTGLIAAGKMAQDPSEPEILREKAERIVRRLQ